MNEQLERQLSVAYPRLRPQERQAILQAAAAIGSQGLIAARLARRDAQALASTQGAADFDKGLYFALGAVQDNLDGSAAERPPMRHHGIGSEGADATPRAKLLEAHNKKFFDAVEARNQEKAKHEAVLRQNHPESAPAREAKLALDRLARVAPPAPTPFEPEPTGATT